MSVLNGTIVEVDCPHCKHTNCIWVITKVGRHGQQIIVCDECDGLYIINYRTDVTVYEVKQTEV